MLFVVVARSVSLVGCSLLFVRCMRLDVWCLLCGVCGLEYVVHCSLCGLVFVACSLLFVVCSLLCV